MKKTVITPAGLVIGALLFFVIGVAAGNGPVNIQAYVASRNSQNKSLPDTLDYSGVNEVYQIIRDKYDGKLSAAQLLEGAKTGLAQATGDPYTEYFNPKDASAFNDQLNGSFTGIGAKLGQDSDGNIEVIAPLAGSPAMKAGVQSKDIIAQIDGKSTAGLSIDAAVSKIRGPKGTKVVLSIVRGKTQALSITVVRDEIKIPSVTHKILDGNVGYLQISQFSDDTSDLAHKAAVEFKSKRVKGVILDLRDDPGGLVTAAVDVSSLWLPRGELILQEKRGGKVVNSYSATGNNILSGIPTVVLVNSGSASASEITAGALHDNGAAKIIGEKSYGKGSVQELRKLADGSEVKVTIARWYRPNGQNIDKKGITPDKIVTLSVEDAKKGNDTQLKAAEAAL